MGRQTGLSTFGGSHILSLITEDATMALKADLFQKCNIHRSIRSDATVWIVDGVLRGCDMPAFDNVGRFAHLIDDSMLAES